MDYTFTVFCSSEPRNFAIGSIFTDIVYTLNNVKYTKIEIKKTATFRSEIICFFRNCISSVILIIFLMSFFFCCHPDVITHHHGDELTRRFMMTMLTGLQILQGINCVLYDIWRHCHFAIGDVMSQKKRFFFIVFYFFLVRSMNAQVNWGTEKLWANGTNRV